VFSTHTKRIVFLGFVLASLDISNTPDAQESRLFATLNWSPTMDLMLRRPKGLP
jgi:hypothetical protein